MAIFNTNEFLRKTFSKTIFGTAALRPEAVCADGFTLSIQASGMHYCIPNEDLSDAITLRSNSATCLRRSKSFCRLLKTTRRRWLRSTGMCP